MIALLAVTGLGCTSDHERTASNASRYEYPVAPPVTDPVEGAIAWKPSDLVMHEYMGASAGMRRYFYFTRFSTVIAAVGDENDFDSIENQYHHWKLDSHGCLLISEEENGDPYATFALLELSRDRAQLLNLESDAIEVYSRRMTD